MPLVPSAISGSTRDASVVTITGSVICLGADPDVPLVSPAVGIDSAYFISGSIGGKSKGINQSVTIVGGDAVISGTTYISGTIATLSDSVMRFDAAGEIQFDADGGSFLFNDNTTSLLKITNNSSDVMVQPMVSNKDLQFLDAGSNMVASVDSSQESFQISRKWGLGIASIMNSSATLSNDSPFNMIVNGTSNAMTGTLPDPTFNGQLKIVVGLQSASGAVVLAYKNAAGSSVEKVLTSGLALQLIGFDASGGGAFRWILVGDVSA